MILNCPSFQSYGLLKLNDDFRVEFFLGLLLLFSLTTLSAQNLQSDYKRKLDVDKKSRELDEVVLHIDRDAVKHQHNTRWLGVCVGLCESRVSLRDRDKHVSSLLALDAIPSRGRVRSAM
jgi:hypothetical protein